MHSYLMHKISVSRMMNLFQIAEETEYYSEQFVM